MRLPTGMAVILCLLSTVRPVWAVDEVRPVALEDILRMQDFGQVAVASRGRHIVFEVIPPYIEAPNLDTLSIATGRENRVALSKLYVFDRAHPQTPAIPLFVQDPKAGYWLGNLSPNEERISIYELKEGVIRAGVYDFQKRDLEWFPFTPDYSDEAGSSLRGVWISDDELIFPRLPDRVQPAIIDRSRTARRLNQLWTEAFSGKGVSATAIDHRPGKALAFDSIEGSLVRVEVGTAKVIELAKGRFSNLRVAPGFQHISAAVATDYFSALGVNRKTLVVFDLKDNASVVPCVECLVREATPLWSYDGTRLLFASWPTTENPEENVIHEYVTTRNTITEIARVATKGGCHTATLSATWVGNEIAIFRRAEIEREARPAFRECDRLGDLYLTHDGHYSRKLTAGLKRVSGDVIAMTRDAIYLHADGAIWRIDSSGRREDSIPKMSNGVAPQEFVVDRLPRGAVSRYPTVSEPLVALRSGAHVVVTQLGTGVLQSYELTNEDAELLALGRQLAVYRVNFRGGSFLALLESTGDVRSIYSINGHLAEVVPAHRQVVQSLSPNGTALKSCLLSPPLDSTGVHPRPLIAIVYPGLVPDCSNDDVIHFDPFSPEIFTSHGFSVLLVNAPASEIQTTSGLTVGVTALVNSAVDEVVRAGYAEENQTGVYGFSQGFHAVLQVITNTIRYEAAVAGFGVSNVISHYGTSSLGALLDPSRPALGNAGRYEGNLTDTWLGSAPWTDPELYIQNSPVLHANKIDTPLLILHSDFDYFPHSQSEEIFNALFRLNKEVSYVTYWGEGHGPVSPANIRDFWARTIGWFIEHLCFEGECSSLVQ